MEPPAEPILAWEFFWVENPSLSCDEAKEAWNALPLNQRQPFLEEARAAADSIVHNSKKPRGKKNPFNFFLKQKHEERGDSSLSIAALSQELAPMWQSMSTTEKQPFADLAKEDAERWKRERAASEGLSKRLKLAMVTKQTYEAIESEPLSGFQVFLAANWDVRNNSALQEQQLLNVWLDMTASQQHPWKEQAAMNQKSYAMSRLNVRKKTKMPMKEQ